MNLDRLQLFPNQRIDGNPTECVGLTIADIWGNYTGVPRDPDFSYAQYFKLRRQTPSTLGADAYEAMQAAVVYGTLPASADTTSALQYGQLYVANPQNYSKDQNALALGDPPKGFTSLPSNLDIRQSLLDRKIGVPLTIKWYDNFSDQKDGELPPPEGNFQYHCVAVYDFDGRGLKIKPWLGKDWGDGGYGYLTVSRFWQCFVSAYTFEPTAWRWLSLAQIGLTHPRAIPDILPQMIANPHV